MSGKNTLEVIHHSNLNFEWLLEPTTPATLFLLPAPDEVGAGGAGGNDASGGAAGAGGDDDDIMALRLAYEASDAFQGEENNEWVMMDDFCTPEKYTCDFCGCTHEDINDRGHNMVVGNTFVGRYYVLICHQCSNEKSIQCFGSNMTWEKSMEEEENFPKLAIGRGFALMRKEAVVSEI
jgi:hypothetical protein